MIFRQVFSSVHIFASLGLALREWPWGNLMRTPRNLPNHILSTVTTGVEPACTHAVNVVGLPLPYMTIIAGTGIEPDVFGL